MKTEDGYIISKCLNGNSASFGFLVDKYKASVYAFAYSELRNFHDAEDVTQEVFIKAYQKLHTLRRWDNFLAWLYSITSNACKMWRRSESRRPDSHYIEDQGSEIATDPWYELPILGTLKEALESLPEHYRKVLTLYYLGEMDSNEIAKFLGKSPSAVRRSLVRARSRLREDVIEMMGETFELKRLQASFTFRIVEAAKRINVNPVSISKGVPWGLSLASGILVAFLSMGININPMDRLGTPRSSSLGGEYSVPNVGEFSVDIMKMSDTSNIGDQFGGDSSNTLDPNLQNALLIEPQAESGTWAKKADMTTARGGLASATANGRIYVFGGGKGFGQVFSTVEEYNPKTDSWQKKSDMPTPRAYFSASEVNGKIYAIGGANGIGTPLSVVEEYDPITDEWTKKANMPTSRYYFSACVLDEKIYVAGGTNGPNGDSSKVEVYDPVNDTWEKRANLLGARRGLSISTVNGKIYAIGGWLQKVLTVVEEYDPIADTWVKKSDMPTARTGLSTSVIDGRIYAIGGSMDVIKAASILECYDPTTDSWEKKTNMPVARVNFSSNVVDGLIYTMGGGEKPLVWGMQVVPVLSSMEVYDPEGTSQGIKLEGKLPATWGEMRTAKNK